MNILDKALKQLEAAQRDMNNAYAMAEAIQATGVPIPTSSGMYGEYPCIEYDTGAVGCSVEELITKLVPVPVDFIRNEMQPCKTATEFYPVFIPPSTSAGPTWFALVGGELYRVTTKKLADSSSFKCPEGYVTATKGFAGGYSMTMFVRKLKDADVRSVELIDGKISSADKDIIDEVVAAFASEYPVIARMDDDMYDIPKRIRNVLRHRSGLAVEVKYFRSTCGTFSLRIEYCDDRNKFFDYDLRTPEDATPCHPKEIPVVLA